MPETRTTSSTGGQKGVKLARFDLIPQGPLRELAEHYGRGARKYANHQWRQGYEWSKSIGALGRHFSDFMAGMDYDVCSNRPEECSFVDQDGQPYEPTEPDTCFNHTGSHHMAAVAWHAFLLLEFKDSYPQHDDRYRPAVEEEPEQLISDELWDAATQWMRDNGFAAWKRPPEGLVLVDGVYERPTSTHDTDAVLDLAAYARPVRFIAGWDGTRDLKLDTYQVRWVQEYDEEHSRPSLDDRILLQQINDRLYNFQG
jgi:hypothetical protein